MSSDQENRVLTEFGMWVMKEHMRTKDSDVEYAVMCEHAFQMAMLWPIVKHKDSLTPEQLVDFNIELTHVQDILETLRDLDDGGKS